jgi:hypothetical protein
VWACPTNTGSAFPLSDRTSLFPNWVNAVITFPNVAGNKGVLTIVLKARSGIRIQINHSGLMAAISAF